MSISNINLALPFIVGSFARVLRQTGFLLNGVSRNFSPEEMVKDQPVSMYDTAPATSYAITPGATPPALQGEQIASRSLVLTELIGSRFDLTGEDYKAIRRVGPGSYISAAVDERIAALIHGLTAFVATRANQGAGLALGTVGTNPFASDPDIVNGLVRTLDENLAPPDDRFLALTPAEKEAALNLDQFQRLQDAPEGTSFARGELGRLGGMLVGMDQSLPSTGFHTAGAGTGYLVNAGGGVAVGATTIPVDTGTGALNAGDVITIAGDTTRYVVAAAYAGGAGNLTINEGLKQAAADNAAITRLASHRINLCMQRGAIEVAARMPAEVEGGDLADVVAPITDPVTGLTCRLARYPGYHAGQWELSILYGAAVRRPRLLRKLIA